MVRSQQHLQKHWKIAGQLFLPITPLLASLALSTHRLGQLIASAIDPDADNRMPTIAIIKANVVWLFSRDNHFRSEGLSRLTYMLHKMENASDYLPNIGQVSDVLQSNLCLVSPITSRAGDELDNINDYDSLKSLLAMLTNDVTLDRSLRHQALAQIDFMALDARCTEVIHTLDGVRIILDILDKALQVNTYAIFANDATLAVSILRKVCARMPSARIRLANDTHIYSLLLRTLLLFQHDDQLRRNCSALLFMLAFNEYIVGGTLNVGLNVPSIVKKLNAPIECEYGWHTPTRNPFSVLLSPNDGGETGRSHVDTLSRRTQSPAPVEQLVEHSERCWRHIRMAFATAWFGSLDKCTATNGYLHAGNAKLNYRINPHALKFCPALQIQAADLDIVAGTSPLAGIQYWMKQIQSATSSGQVVDALAAIESFSNVGAAGQGCPWSYDEFLDAIRRFCTTMPNSRCDEQLFMGICRLLANFIERDASKILLWTLSELNRDRCVFVEVLRASKVDVGVFMANAAFVEAVLMKTIQTPAKKHFEQLIMWTSSASDKQSVGSKKSSNQPSNLYEKMFDILLGLVDGMIVKKRFVELGCLVSMIRVVTSSAKIPPNFYTTSYVANKLLGLIAALNSHYHVGSMFVKNSLLTIGNLMMRVNDLRIDDKYMGLLIMLCGHADLEIRTYAWSILLKVATNFAQAQNLLQMANKQGLPNGLYGCSLHTLLDDEESAIVREHAGFTFATLLMQYNCCADDEQRQHLLPKNAPSNWLELLLRHNQLLDKVTEALDFLYVNESCGDQHGKPIVPCNLLRSYCVVLINVLTLNIVDFTRIVGVSVKMCR